MALLTKECHQYTNLATPTTIRILVLHPAEDLKAPIQIDFECFDRNSLYQPDISNYYEAVSYCWGKSDFSHSVLVQDSQGLLKVTANVDSMLRHMRKTRKSRRFWIDALCINQSDVDEKTIQVREMGAIYQEANKVHVWLGAEAAFDVGLVFEYFKKIVIRNELRQWAKPESALDVHFGASHAMLGENVQQLLLHPWFGRRWVLQEVSLGHDITVHIGLTKISWEWLTKGIMAFQDASMPSHFDWVWKGYSALSRAVNITKTSSLQKQDLQDLLLAHASAECLDPRDRIYALYGIAELTASGPHMPEVDYSSHWINTYMTMAEIMLQESPRNLWKHLRVFHPLSASYTDAPSWIPDWTRSDISTTLRQHHIRTGSEKILRSKDGRHLLQLSGWMYGPIQYTTRTLSPSNQTSLDAVFTGIQRDASLDDVTRGIDNQEDFINSWEGVESRKNIWQEISTLIAQVARTQNPRSHDERGLNEYWYDETSMNITSVQKSIRNTYDTTTILFKENRNDQHVSNLINAVLEWKKLFRIRDPRTWAPADSHGLLGIGEDLQEGDFVLRCSDEETDQQFVTFNTEVFLVIRPCLDPQIESEDNSLFKFVGFCYLHGGEALPGGSMPGIYSWREFSTDAFKTIKLL